MLSALTGIIVSVALVVIGFLRGTKPYEETWVVTGERDGWLQKCCDALQATARFSEVRVFEDTHEIEAKYHRPAVSARLHLTLTPHRAGSTQVKAHISVLPTPVVAIIRPEPRIAARFSRSAGLGESSTLAHPGEAVGVGVTMPST